ncbi:hypothetical protein HO173_005470 [Letharia columbiana]|uniref:Uncharacterized protein n=1 Tax=Letharia columbiana TaxID=112416 RepID=A0A8H6L5L1_9LECA|nr:uncharacterized protein HO173_005470 [Letharia columbiana]KAF6236379.1 hypothetical protein HO173_005470 [Letharia columbiana]
MSLLDAPPWLGALASTAMTTIYCPVDSEWLDITPDDECGLMIANIALAKILELADQLPPPWPEARYFHLPGLLHQRREQEHLWNPTPRQAVDCRQGFGEANCEIDYNATGSQELRNSNVDQFASW